jgi:hypothetical protein
MDNVQNSDSYALSLVCSVFCNITPFSAVTVNLRFGGHPPNQKIKQETILKQSATSFDCFRTARCCIAEDCPVTFTAAATSPAVQQTLPHAIVFIFCLYPHILLYTRFTYWRCLHVVCKQLVKLWFCIIILRIEDVKWSAWRIPTAVFSDF